MQNKDIASVLVVTIAILTVPLKADWKLFDFVVMGTLLAGTGLLMVLASRKIKSTNRRVIVIVALLAALICIWAELAVGVFTNLGS